MNLKTRPSGQTHWWAWRSPIRVLSPGLNCAAFILMALYLLILPIPHTIAIRHIAFFSLFLLTLWAAWRHHLKFYFPLVWPWAIYAALALSSVIYALDPFYSLGEVRKEIGHGFIALMLAGTWVRSAKNLERMLAVLILGSTVMAAYSIINVILQRSYLMQTPIQEGSFSGVGVFSTYLITVLPFIIVYIILMPKEDKLRRGMLYLAVVMEVAALYLTGNRAGMLALNSETVLALVLLSLHNGLPNVRKTFLAVVILILLSGLFLSLIYQRNVVLTPDVGADQELVSNDPRWPIWQRAMQNIYHHPLVGAGFGREAFKLRNPDLLNGNDVYWHAHNMFLNKGVQMGIPGMVAFVVLLMAIIRAVWIPKGKVAESGPAGMYAMACIVMLGGVIVKNMTDDFFVQDSALLFWVLVGATLGALSGERKIN